MKQIQQRNQQLTDRQQRLSQVIVQGGNETEVSFAKKTIDFVKIKDLDDADFEIGLSLLLTRIVNLLGIKEAVSDLNKQDIVEMLDIGFKNLSLRIRFRIPYSKFHIRIFKNNVKIPAF